MNLVTTVWNSVTSEAGQIWCLGFGAAAMIKLFKVGLRWAKRAAGGGPSSDYGD